MNSLSFISDLICKIEKIKINIPPIVPIILNIISDTWKDENVHKIYDNTIINGNSAIVCPNAIFNPTKDPYLLPYKILIKKILKVYHHHYIDQ